MSDLLIDDIYALVRFPRDARTGLLGLELPSTREVARLYKEQGIRAMIPDGGSEFWNELTTRAYTELKQLRNKAAMAPKSSVPTPGTVRTPSVTRTVSGEEARIRMMKGAEAMAECKAKRIAVITHATNPGITAMRAKNALLNSLKKEPPPPAPVPVVQKQVRPAPAVRPAPGAKKIVKWIVD